MAAPAMFEAPRLRIYSACEGAGTPAYIATLCLMIAAMPLSIIFLKFYMQYATADYKGQS